MKTCKDCIHFDVCSGYILVVHCSKDSNTDAEKVCSYFKDESKYVEVNAPHGRLIDAESLKNKIETDYCVNCSDVDDCGICVCQNCGVDRLLDYIDKTFL